MELSSLGAPRVLGRVPFRAVGHAAMDVSPDGHRVALLSPGHVELLDADGARLALLDRHDTSACGLFVDDRRLLVGRSDGSLLLLDVDALAAAGTLRGDDARALGTLLPLSTAPIARFARSPDGRLVAVSCLSTTGRQQKPDKLVRVLDASTLATRLALKGLRRNATDLAFSPDGARLAVAGDASVRVYELAKGKAVAALGVEDDAGVAWRDDGSLLTLGRTNGLRAWRLEGGAVLAQRPFAAQTLCGPRVTPDGAVLVVAGGSFEPMVVHRLDAATLAPEATRTLGHLPLWARPPRVMPDGSAWVGQGLAHRRLRGRTLDPDPMADGTFELATHFAVHPGGRWAASGDFVGEVRVWDLDAGRMTAHLPAESRVLAGTLSSYHRLVSLGFADVAPRLTVQTERGGLRCWDAAAGEWAWSLPPEALVGLLRVFAAPEGEAVLAVCGAKKGVEVSLVDASGRARWTTALPEMPEAVHWGRDAVLLADLTGSERLRRSDGAVEGRWRFAGEVIHAHRSAVWLSLSGDGTRAAAVNTFGRLATWRTEGAELLSVEDTRAHGLTRVTGVRWADDGALLLVEDDRRVEARDPVTLALRSSVALPMPARWTAVPTRGGRRLVVPTHEGPWVVFDGA